MDNQQWQVAKKVAATYIGTVVGAGFATGREIVVIFYSERIIRNNWYMYKWIFFYFGSVRR